MSEYSKPPKIFGKEELPANIPITERHRGKIGIGLAVLLLGLALWAIRLIKGGAKA